MKAAASLKPNLWSFLVFFFSGFCETRIILKLLLHRGGHKGLKPNMQVSLCALFPVSLNGHSPGDKDHSRGKGS